MMADSLQERDAGAYHVLLNPLLTASGAAPAAASMPDVSTRCTATACRQGWLCGLVALQSALLVFTTSLLVLRGGLLSTVHAPDVRFDQPIFLSECLHPMGGGAVSWQQLTDGFPMARSALTTGCSQRNMQPFYAWQSVSWRWVAPTPFETLVPEAIRKPFATLCDPSQSSSVTNVQVQAGGGFKPLNDSVVSDECASEMQVYFSRQVNHFNYQRTGYAVECGPTAGPKPGRALIPGIMIRTPYCADPGPSGVTALTLNTLGTCRASPV